MPLQVTCPHCGRTCLIAEQHLGSQVRCAACAKIFVPAGPSTDDDFPLPGFDALATASSHLGLHLDIGAATSAGRVRAHNEDRCLIRRQTWNQADDLHELALLCIADGMGGHAGGATASAFTIQALQQALGPLFDDALAGRLRPDAHDVIAQRLSAALNDASKAVHVAAQADPQLKSMGAAAIAALVWGPSAHIAHVGDCRAYHFHADALVPLTKDHSLVQRMLELGTLKPHEARHHPARDELTQAIGRRPQVEPGVCRVAIAKDDWLILACDGLQAHLDVPALQQHLRLALPAAALVARQLVEAADQRGGSDNCTVLAVHCS